MGIGIFLMITSYLGHNMVKQQVIVALMDRMEIIFSKGYLLRMVMFALF